MVSRLTDTLAKRLFLLMWGALVVSHLLAWGTVRLLHTQPSGPRMMEDRGPRGGFVPTIPSLPPTPGLPGGRPSGEPREPLPPPPELHGDDFDGPPPLRPAPRREGGFGRGGFPTWLLVVDYGVRLLVIALAAWWGSRWVSAPMRSLAKASRDLGPALSQDAAPKPLDEQQGTREVRETAQVFNTMATQLHRQFRSRGLMVAAISHDLRTPLTRLRMRLELMEEQPVLQAKSVADVQEMDRLIDKVLEVFRGGTQAEPPQKVDVPALLHSLVDDLAEQGHALSFDDATPEAIVLASPEALSRVFGNLLGNALRYGGRADVRVLQQGKSLRVQIDDAGPGIPPEQLEAVFEPFYRLDASRSKEAGGTGLGLYITRDLLAGQGGTVRLMNRPEGGLRAEVVLPMNVKD